VDLAKMVIDITMQNNAEFVRHVFDAEQQMKSDAATNQSANAEPMEWTVDTETSRFSTES
jgi:hypothetical protein